MTQVAETILQQLGGRRFIAMTGATNFLWRDDGLSFKVGCNASKITHCRVTLTAMDDYIVEFLRIRGTHIEPVAFAQGVYCDTLADVFARKTGLALSL